MATKKSADAPAPEVVKLQCKDLGIESKDFTPKHAADLLAYQESKGYSHWQPVGETPAPTE